MGAEGVAQALGRDALIQNGEVSRVKRRVAQARDGRHQQQAAVTGGLRRHQRGQQKAANRRKQHRTRAQPVHHKTRQRLPDAGDGEKQRHQQPHVGVAQTEIADEDGEQRRQQQVGEMRGAVRQTNQADHGGVLLQRHRVGGGNGVQRGGVHRGEMLRRWAPRPHQPRDTHKTNTTSHRPAELRASA